MQQQMYRIQAKTMAEREKLLREHKRWRQDRLDMMQMMMEQMMGQMHAMQGMDMGMSTRAK